MNENQNQNVIEGTGEFSEPKETKKWYDRFKMTPERRKDLVASASEVAKMVAMAIAANIVVDATTSVVKKGINSAWSTWEKEDLDPETYADEEFGSAEIPAE